MRRYPFMINPKLLRDSPQLLLDALSKRGHDHAVFKTWQSLDTQWREHQQLLESHQSKRNQLIPKGKPTPEQRQQLVELSATIKTLQQTVDTLKASLADAALSIPNLLHDDVPVGHTDEDNPVVKTIGSPPSFKFTPKSHDELGIALNLLDFERATKISGSRFAIFKGLGARLERAVASFMLDSHIQKFGYEELSPPVIINSNALQGTGQLPKFKDDQYALDDPFWLSPTAEVQLTNYHANEILSETDLPKQYCAFTPCFRKEAGSYGKDMKGLIRLHQFNKVELVQLVKPEDSSKHLHDLLGHAQYILDALELPYRVVSLCGGDVGFSSSQTFDLEVWMPAQNQYREISSCSNFLDFQSRRAKIRYRDADQNIQYVHTLNGSGLAVGRTIAAILENFQDSSGIIKIPTVLVPYMGVEEIKHG